jgi:hypothetical protein
MAVDAAAAGAVEGGAAGACVKAAQGNIIIPNAAAKQMVFFILSSNF